MYALERNGSKYKDRDNRKEKIQHLEYNYLAPDSLNEIVASIELFERLTGKAFYNKNEPGKEFTNDEMIAKGKELLEARDPVVEDLEILADGFENSKRKVFIIKIVKSYHIFKEVVRYYCVNQVVNFIKEKQISSYPALIEKLPVDVVLNEWLNVGGQLIPKSEINLLNKSIDDEKINSWDGMHAFYQQQAEVYTDQKLSHSVAALQAVSGVTVQKMGAETFGNMLASAIATKEWMTEAIYQSRAKDYANPFRKITYSTEKEMDEVVGKLEDNSFIKQQREGLENYKKQIKNLLKDFDLHS